MSAKISRRSLTKGIPGFFAGQLVNNSIIGNQGFVINNHIFDHVVDNLSNHLKITLVAVFGDAAAGSGSDKAFSIVFDNATLNLRDSNTAVHDVNRKYNIQNGAVLLDRDIKYGHPCHLEIWADKSSSLFPPYASNIGGIFIATDNSGNIAYNLLVTGLTCPPGANGDPSDLISLRMNNSGSSYKLLTKWECNHKPFLGKPMQGWNGC